MSNIMKRVVRHPDQFDCIAISRDDAEAIKLATEHWRISFSMEAANCTIVSRERMREKTCRKCGKLVFTPISEGKTRDLCPPCERKDRHERELFFRGKQVKSNWRYKW